MLLTQDASVLDWDVDAQMNKAAVRRFGLGGAMVAVIAGIAGLSYWDARRESAAALQDFAQEQATLAGALGAALRIRFAAGSSITEDDLLAGLRSVERPTALVIVARRPHESMLRTTDGRDLAAPRLTEALDRGDSVVRIPRDESARFGCRRGRRWRGSPGSTPDRPAPGTSSLSLAPSASEIERIGRDVASF